MDGAQASNRYFADGTPVFGSMGHRVGGRGGCEEARGVSLSETAYSADLGGSSKYSNANFED